MREHGHAVRALQVGGGSTEFTAALRRAAFARLRDAAPDDYTARFLAGALVETVIWWAEGNFAVGSQRLAEAYASLTALVLV